MPKIVDGSDEICKIDGRCLDKENLGLTFPNTICPKEYTPKLDKDNKDSSRCPKFMINKCAKELWDSGCLKMKTFSDGNRKAPIFDTSNPRCLTKEGLHGYGSEECACVNSVLVII